MIKGYFPKGGGKITVKIPPRKQKLLNSVMLEDPGEIAEITIFSSVAGVLPIKMAHAMVEGATNVLNRELTSKNEVKFLTNVKKENDAFGNGSSIVIVA